MQAEPIMGQALRFCFRQTEACALYGECWHTLCQTPYPTILWYLISTLLHEKHLLLCMLLPGKSGSLISFCTRVGTPCETHVHMSWTQQHCLYCIFMQHTAAIAEISDPAITTGACKCHSWLGAWKVHSLLTLYITKNSLAGHGTNNHKLRAIWCLIWHQIMTGSCSLHSHVERCCCDSRSNIIPS